MIDRPLTAIMNPDGTCGSRPMDDEEYAQWQLDQAAFAETAVAEQRGVMQGTILGLLADTDKWAARAVEENVPMNAERVAYRQALRAQLAQAAVAADLKTLDAIKLPAMTQAAADDGTVAT